MASTSKQCGQMILKQVLEEGPGELSSKDPMVLSCGGIYIPRPRRETKTFLYHILTTPNDAEPVKVVCGAIPKNVLHQVMAKESMN